MRVTQICDNYVTHTQTQAHAYAHAHAKVKGYVFPDHEKQAVVKRTKQIENDSNDY